MTACLLRLMTSLLFLTVPAQLSAQARQKSVLLIPDTITVERDIVYVEAGDYPLTLDMAIPKGLSKPVPVVVHIHGGGFQNGQKSTRYALRYLGGLFTLIPDQVRRANPFTYVDKNDPPTLIFHGEKDFFVPINQSEMLYNALKKAGAVTELVRVTNGGHGYKPTPPGSVIRPSRKEMTALELKWFQKHLEHQ